MFRVTKLSGTFYALEFDLGDDNAIEDIDNLVDSGEVVTLVDDLDSACDFFGIDIADIIIVQPE
jgi:hypothetical protein